MVIQRTIEHLKTRPKDERKMFATSVAFGVLIILFSVWVFMFFRGLRSATPVQQAATVQSGQTADPADQFGAPYTAQ